MMDAAGVTISLIAVLIVAALALYEARRGR